MGSSSNPDTVSNANGKEVHASLSKAYRVGGVQKCCRLNRVAFAVTPCRGKDEAVPGQGHKR